MRSSLTRPDIVATQVNDANIFYSHVSCSGRHKLKYSLIKKNALMKACCLRPDYLTEIGYNMFDFVKSHYRTIFVWLLLFLSNVNIHRYILVYLNKPPDWQVCLISDKLHLNGPFRDIMLFL